MKRLELMAIFLWSFCPAQLYGQVLEALVCQSSSLFALTVRVSPFLLMHGHDAHVIGYGEDDGGTSPMTCS